MKKILMQLLILLVLFNNINPMEGNNNKIREEIIEEENNLGKLDILPNELMYEIIKFIIEDNINNWRDIFNFDNDSLKNDLDRVRLISKDFTVFGKEELKNFIKKLKEKRLEHLKEKIKDQYKGSSKEELNQKLINFLNAIYLRSSTEKLEEYVRLIIAGANIHVTDNRGKTALMIAVYNGHIKVVKLLIDMGANIHVADKSGNTALIYAAWKGYIEVVKLLIDRKVNINVTSNNSWTALAFAQEYGHEDIVELLKFELLKSNNTKSCNLQ